MGKFKSLISNTLLFGIAQFSAKLLNFFIMPLLTQVLPPDQLGDVKLAINTCNLILPIMYLCISEAIIRFGLDPDSRKSDVYTTGVLTVLAGYLVILCALPLLTRLPEVGSLIAQYQDLVRLYILASAARTVTTHFVRAGGLVRIFALDGLLTTVLTFLLIYVFLFKLKLGARGYMLATICADAFSALFMTVFLRLYRFFKLKGLRWDMAKEMLRYSIPLVPTAVFWWVINLSDTYFVKIMVGSEENGLYTAAGTIPAIIIVVSQIFTQAWQISAFSEQSRREAERFYTNVFRSYYAFIFLAASGIILLVRPITTVLVDETYFDSWQYVTVLVLATSFSCLVTFLGTIYNVVKKNAMVTITTAVGAAMNLILNAVMIPKFGPIGAAFATFISYFAVFLIRAVDTRRYIKIAMQPVRMAASLGILLAQIGISLSQPKLGVLWQVLLFLTLIFVNLGYILFITERFFSMLPFWKRHAKRRR